MKLTVFVTTAVFMILNTMFCIKVFASGSNIVYDGNSKDFVCLADGGMFSDADTLYPGGKAAQEIKLKNGSDKYVSIYLCAQPTQNRYEPFLDLISLSVYDSGGECISSSDKSIEGGVRNKILIADLSPGQEKNITVMLYADNRLGDKLQGTMDKIRWVFSDKEDKSLYRVCAEEVQFTKEKEPTEYAPPNTGDKGTEIYISCTAVLSALVAVTVIKKRYHIKI